VKFEADSENNRQLLPRFGVHRANLLREHKDFEMKIDSWHSIEDFNWEEQTYGILYKYNAPLADAINQQSEFAFKMTKGTFGNENVDTRPFRTAI
jgi:hypothetical protein